MKQVGILIISAMMVLTQVNAQTKQPKADMAFDKTVEGLVFHDFGSIVYGANGKVDFNFTNQGTKPLAITDVKSSCGCTVPTWTKEPVEPGKSGTITIVYNTKLAGPFNKTVEVYSNANNSPVRISIKGKVNAQASDIKPQIQTNDSKKNVVMESGEMEPGQDSAKRAQAEQMKKAQMAAQEEAFKKLMEQSAEQKPKATQTSTPPAKTEVKQETTTQQKTTQKKKK